MRTAIDEDDFTDEEAEEIVAAMGAEELTEALELAAAERDIPGLKRTLKRGEQLASELVGGGAGAEGGALRGHQAEREPPPEHCAHRLPRAGVGGGKGRPGTAGRSQSGAESRRVVRVYVS